MKTILIVEDNPDILENTADILELEGYQICRARNGLEGIAVAVTNLPDLILCDIIMPEADGYEVLRRLKENSATAEIPFVFVSASVEPKEVAVALSRGANGFLRKPFEARELLDMVSGLTRRDA